MNVKKNFMMPEKTIEELRLIVKERRHTTESAAVIEAIQFRAALAKRELSEVNFALTMLEDLRSLQSRGYLLLESRDGARQRVIVPGLSGPR